MTTLDQFHTAIQKHDHDTFTALMTNKALLNRRGSLQTPNPLSIAVLNNNYYAANVLLKQGARIEPLYTLTSKTPGATKDEKLINWLIDQQPTGHDHQAELFNLIHTIYSKSHAAKNYEIKKTYFKVGASIIGVILVAGAIACLLTPIGIAVGTALAATVGISLAAPTLAILGTSAVVGTASAVALKGVKHFHNKAQETALGIYQLEMNHTMYRAKFPL